MTCIVGLVEDGRVLIGGDSAGVGGGYSLLRMADEKVFINGEFAMGFTSSFRMGQLLRHKFKPPQHYPTKDVMTYMVTDFIDGVRECLKTAGFAKKDKEEESAGTFLVGYHGRLFRVEDHYSVLEVSAGYDACGCGENIARGALYATRDAKSAEDRVTLALEAAEFHSAGVRAPFHISIAPRAELLRAA